MGAEYLWETKKGVANYVIARPLATAAALVADRFGAYGRGSLSPAVAYPYIAFATNCSQMWALYCLVMFFRAFRDELAPIRPLAKFVCIKAVVFLTFWQVRVIVWGCYDGWCGGRVDGGANYAKLRTLPRVQTSTLPSPGATHPNPQPHRHTRSQHQPTTATTTFNRASRSRSSSRRACCACATSSRRTPPPTSPRGCRTF